MTLHESSLRIILRDNFKGGFFMSEKMLVTQALDERDLLVKKISDKIDKASFVDTIKPNEDKVYSKRIGKDEYAKEAESAYQQIVDLIERFQKIDAAIVASNAETEITTSYGKFTVAGAISLRSRLRGLPLFSEMKFLGVKIKKEVQKETEEVKGLLQNLQTQVNQLQLTNSVANNINLSNATLPSEQKIEELLQRVTELQASYPNSGTEVKDSVPKGEDKNVYLFKVRLDIETSLREMCEKIGHTERMTIVKMVQLLNHAQVINGMTCDLINQVNKIANRVAWRNCKCRIYRF